jgi:arsenate reductase (glutaredoxin)
MILYGIPTCDTCRKAERALKEAGHTVNFRDIRADPLSATEWQGLIHEFGDALVNRNSPTWRGLSDWMKASEADAQLAANPTLMKRPVLQDGAKMTLGWDVPAQAIWCL